VVRFRIVSSTKVSAPLHWVPEFVPWRYNGRGLKITALFYSAEVKNEWRYASISPCAVQRDSCSLILLCLITLVVPSPKFDTVRILCGILYAFEERLVYAPFLCFCHQPKVILYERELNKISIKYYKPRF